MRNSDDFALLSLILRRSAISPIPSIYQYLRTNITRCSVCSWWQNFVEELESVRLVAREVIQHRVEQIDNWIEYQVGPSLAILFRTMGWPHIFELAIEAGRRLSDKHQSLISDYNSLQSALA